MDFVVGLPRTRRQHDSIWVIVDRLTKSAHFFRVKVSYSTEDDAKLYIKEIVKLYGTPLSIILDRGSQFTSHFWRSFQSGLGTQLKHNNAFHPQTDGQEERTIQTLEEMLRACFIDFKALYGRRCRSPVGWFEVGEFALLGPEVVCEATLKVLLIRDRLKTAHSRQKSYADNRKRDLEFEVVDWVYLKITPMKGVMSLVRRGSLAPGLGVKLNLSYEEVPVKILDRQVKKLRNKKVASVKFLWINHLVEGATWEAEANMKSCYPHLFPSTPSQS
ncbi:hypothetical protein MTR67_031705 [Solanum verrucosum]|uniref:Integrase catalytic domain-containing protein n=1 Tax=Solanum verrucosum TaxID=315347 RepID=A0AAF0U2X9_SOLVR|nr:hypothetical protein MTR67_031705 [Solanum verrucosum]